ncbi:SRPBCC family protein [Arthrobacter sp. CDRTa11]|uniref:SRPBCC family protein n=1 Tax=Arthrobacter sp. CDRTa11 TaxID=2651199 RepID=UPI002265AB7B|nr:SRPBCC family protein [Arthrobacter sp. CDRTa11]UZX04702.1 SRPBCC family protein [Arthrobacter sp. CDRTa11]
MKQQRTAGNVLSQEVAVTVREHTTAPAYAVFDVLTNLPGHLQWGGAEASTLLSMAAPEGQAPAGTEFSSTAEDRICRIRNSSVVTEAVRPLRFEQVTESALVSKKNGTTADWVLVHRYEIEADGNQSNVTYTCRLVRATGLPGLLAMFGIPVLRSIASVQWARASRAGLRRLIAAAETAAQGEPAPTTRKEQDNGKAND